jgi:RHS repeat-associated protein
VSVTDALNHTAQFNYFGADLASVTDPLGNVSTQSTDSVGRTISASDALGNTTRYQYNNLNLLTQVTDPQGHTTSFAYDSNGNLLSLTDPVSHTTSYTYDNMDRPLTGTDPLNRKESYSYDANGNLASSADRKGQTTTLSYDGLNRTTVAGFGAVVSGGTTGYESTITYTYDAGNRMTEAVDSVGGTITHAFDMLDRLTLETTSLGSISYGYDAAGRRTTMQVAGQPQISYAYDNASRLTQIAQSTSTTGFNYDSANRRTSLTLGNNVNVSYSYDNDSHLTGITYQVGANILGSLSYSYDTLGRKTQIGGSFARTGLPGAIGSTSYDAANELTNWNGTLLSYDANGNMLSDGSNTFTWNARNQVATLNNISLQYDAFGRRTKNGVGTSFLYNGANAVQELSGSTVTANLLAGGVDQVFTRSDSTGSLTPLIDALGSTIALVDSAGSVQTSYSYDPFGNTTSVGTSSANPSQYTGRDNEGNGLYFYRARYYSPRLGRFISEDPLGVAGGDLNFYAYVFDNPTNLTDPSGLKGDNPITNWFGGVRRNADFAWNWFWQTGSFPNATTRVRTNALGGTHDWQVYGPDTPQTQDMMNSPGMAWVQAVYVWNGCSGNVENIGFSTIPAYLATTPILGDWSTLGSTAFEVGAFSTDITENSNGTVTYNMYNKAGIHSLLGGLNFGHGDHEYDPYTHLPNMDESHGVGGNVRQLFTWTGPKPSACSIWPLKGRK